MSPEKFISSSIWRAKMKTYFKLMDVDKNEVLTLSDFEEIANRLIRLQTDSSKNEKIREMCHSLFQHFIAGGEPVDDNTQITEEELITKVAKTVAEASDEVLQAGRHKNEIFFDIIDTDHSGEISREEYRKYLAIYTGVEQSEQANQAFDSIDSDKSGSISREEFVEAHMHYWFETGDDEESYPLPYGLLVDS
ncbi:EF-hand domain-containing protein [Okeania sp.]|uniref:EF-hand domain-containing protein n=1 Tax=Okeania sp. TaxID=3100323 RepID=UPI002B4B7E7B|nr:EF-hand domain-containing protein [Okeania sp.]MEB3342812.1 EF-hand domain-containing protein [Okeania sp.]